MRHPQRIIYTYQILNAYLAQIWMIDKHAGHFRYYILDCTSKLESLFIAILVYFVEKLEIIATVVLTLFERLNHLLNKQKVLRQSFCIIKQVAPNFD